jgi:hypothetical protein
MDRRLLASALIPLALLAASCGPGAAPVFGDEECVGNTPPLIGNLEVNSVFVEESEMWAVCFHVDWIDPGEDELGNRGSDAPNMYGGLFSIELGGVNATSEWIDEGPSPLGVTIGATEGELEWSKCIEDSKEDQQLHFALRLRDRCGAASNEKTGTYYIGGGGGEPHQVENPDAGTNGCTLPPGTTCIEDE